jgi:hypothetical protein
VRLGHPDVLEQPGDGAILGVKVEICHPNGHQIGHIATHLEDGFQANGQEQDPLQQLKEGDESEHPLA